MTITIHYHLSPDGRDTVISTDPEIPSPRDSCPPTVTLSLMTSLRDAVDDIAAYVFRHGGQAVHLSPEAAIRFAIKLAASELRQRETWRQERAWVVEREAYKASGGNDPKGMSVADIPYPDTPETPDSNSDPDHFARTSRWSYCHRQLKDHDKFCMTFDGLSEIGKKDWRLTVDAVIAEYQRMYPQSTSSLSPLELTHIHTYEEITGHSPPPAGFVHLDVDSQRCPNPECQSLKTVLYQETPNVQAVWRCFACGNAWAANEETPLQESKSCDVPQLSATEEQEAQRLYQELCEDVASGDDWGEESKS